MKIAIFSDTFPPQTNGVANVVCQSAKNLADLGHDVSVFTIFKNIKKAPDISRGNFTIVSSPSLPALIYPNERLAFLPFIFLNRLKKFKPDIIHTHTPFMLGWEAVWGAKIFKIPIIGTHHTFYDHYLKHVKMDYEWAKKISWKYTIGYYNRCDLILSPSQSLAKTLISKGLKKPVAVLRNSINTNLFRPVSGLTAKNNLKKRFGINGRSLVHMGRLSYEKSIDQIVKSFALMLKKAPDLKLMLVGDGPERKNLEKMTEDLGIKNNVIFTGSLYGKELVEALQTNDVFLTASKSENMPLSVLEVMAVGLPVITVKEKGLAEIIKENINGFFAQTDDSENIAQKTLELLTKPELVKKFSQASRQMALEYSEEKVAALLEESYKKILKNKI